MNITIMILKIKNNENVLLKKSKKFKIKCRLKKK